MAQRTSAGETILITGVGMTTPLGADASTTWRALLAGESGTTKLTDDWAVGLPVRIGAPLRTPPERLLGRTEQRRLDRNQQIALIAAREAWADAGTPQVEPERLSVVLGTGIGGSITLLNQNEALRLKGPSHVSPFTIPMLMPNGAAAAVSMDVGARGGSHAPVSACASGAEAIAAAMALIRSGRADVVLAGGTDACLHPLSIAGFARIGALSKRHDDPGAASRPFDLYRDGFVMGEGAGVMVLERRGFARARGARPVAALVGAGVTSDAHHVTTPLAGGQVRALRDAVRDSGLAPSDIAHVNAHATGTVTGDLTESEAIGEAIGDHPTVTSVKSSLGHLLGGAGGVEAIVTALTVRDGLAPPTLNLENRDPAVRLDVIADGPAKGAVPVAVSNSFGFGGHNVVLVLADPEVL